MKQLRAGRKDLYEHPTHLDALRLVIARTAPKMYSGHLAGRQEAIQYGATKDIKLWGEYFFYPDS